MGVVLLVIAVVAVAFIGAGAVGWLPPNRVAGLRTRSSLASHQAWVVSHKAALFVMGPGVAAVVAITVWSMFCAEPMSTVLIVIATVLLILVFIAALIVGDRAARRSLEA